MKKILLFILTFLAVQLICGFGVTIICKLWFPGLNATAGTPLLISIAVYNVIILALFLGLKWYKVNRNYIKSRPWGTLAWTVLLGLGIVIPLTRLEEMIPEAWMKNFMNDSIFELLKSSEGYFLICMLTPLLEEIVFRGAILHTLLTNPIGIRMQSCLNALHISQKTFAIVTTALLFSVVHLNPAQMPHAFIVGLLLGWLTVRTGSIVPAFLVHWINNSAAYVMLNMFPTIPADAKLAAYFGGSDSAVNQAVIFSLMIALPALYQLQMSHKAKN